jgi:peptidoglycan-associated lipoprotein
LFRQAAFLNANPSLTITIEGHCDERGTREYNLALGERRAAAARDYLLAQGVDQARIRVISYGKERPMAAGSNETSWSKNRRSATVLN